MDERSYGVSPYDFIHSLAPHRLEYEGVAPQIIANHSTPFSLFNSRKCLGTVSTKHFPADVSRWLVHEGERRRSGYWSRSTNETFNFILAKYPNRDRGCF